MAAPFVPLTEGSSESRSLDVDGLRAIEAWFPPGLKIPPHRHDRPVLAVMIDGAFDVQHAHGTRECAPSTVFTEPLGERHANRIHSRGAHVVVLQPDPERVEVWDPCRELFRARRHFVDGRISDLARRLGHEIRNSQDSLARLAAEGLALEMLALAARRESEDGHAPPRWLERTRAMLHERFLANLGIGDVAREAGVHPVHLARVFRRHMRMPVAQYLRRLRLDWAARRLEGSEEPLADIALAAGFADQSHFTRAFKRYAGVTPLAFRRRARS